MGEYDNAVMIALLPVATEWCNIDLPHLTLVYAGEKKDLQPNDFNDLVKDTSSLSMLSPRVLLRTNGVEVFGEEEKVDVIKLQATSELWAMRRFVEKWNRSKYKEFKPHVTVGPVGSTVYPIPSYIVFDRVIVSWGTDDVTFRLKN